MCYSWNNQSYWTGADSVMRAIGVVLVAALAFMTLGSQAQAAARCHCARTARHLHQPSTPAERAETARLNREFLAASRGRAEVSAQRRAANVLAAPPSYRSQLEHYRELRETYERQLRAYYQAYPPSNRHADAHARPLPPPAPNARVLEDEARRQDASRLDPWHGYNSHDGPANGY
jgi:hypothetical protein